jgi:cytochrome d ubiquinol oxidase subunit I
MFVIAVNGWMNNPTGFDVSSAGVVSNVHPFSALFNSNLWHELIHMYLAGYIVCGFVVAAVYAVAWLRGERGRYNRVALLVPLTVAAIAAPAQLVVGDWAARTVAKNQPTKLAAFEGLDRTQRDAPLTVGGVYVGGRVIGGISIPDGLSLLSFHDLHAQVQGLDAVPEKDRPPVAVVRNAFQVMVGIGTLLAAIGLFYLVLWWRRRRIPRTKWFYRAVVLAAPASLVALIAGWITTEVGRQPWVVYKVMRTEEAVTGADGIPVGYATLALVYLGLIVVVAFLLRRLARTPEPLPSTNDRTDA